MERGQPLPDWYENEPELEVSERFFISAFWELSSERQLGMAIGQIPGSRIAEFALRTGLDSGMIRVFHLLIRTLDSFYLKHVRAEQERERKKEPAGE